MLHHGVEVSILIVKPWQGRQKIRPSTKQRSFVSRGTFRNIGRAIPVSIMGLFSAAQGAQQSSTLKCFKSPERATLNSPGRSEKAQPWASEPPQNTVKQPLRGATDRCRPRRARLCLPIVVGPACDSTGGTHFDGFAEGGLVPKQRAAHLIQDLRGAQCSQKSMFARSQASTSVFRRSSETLSSLFRKTNDHYRALVIVPAGE